MYIGQSGEEGGNAAADLLCGDLGKRKSLLQSPLGNPAAGYAMHNRFLFNFFLQ